MLFLEIFYGGNNMTEKQIIKFIKENELDIQSAKAALCLCDLVFRTYADRNILEVNLGPIFCYISYNNLDSFYQFASRKKISEITEKLYFGYLRSPRFLKKTVVEHKNLTKELDIIWSDGNLKNKSDKDLLKMFDKIVKTSKEWWYYGAILEDKGGVVDEIIIPRFSARHNLKINDARKIFSALSHPEKQSVFNIARREFLEICLSAAKDKILLNPTVLDESLKRKIRRYLKKYFWLKTNFYRAGNINSKNLAEDISREIQIKKTGGISKELRDLESNFQKINQEKASTFKKIQLSRHDRKDLAFTRAVIYWHDQRKLGMSKQFYYLLSVIEEISCRKKLKYHDLAVCTIKEIRDFMSGKKLISVAEAKKRNNGVFIVFNKSKTIQMFYGFTGKKLFCSASMVKREEIVKGMVASKGKSDTIKGIVRVVFNPASGGFRDNNILVTTMTRVEFIPLIRKAKAVITDEGGIACHAAIISRELGIPCIIGTKIATKVLKDGDLVEVDAGKGEVKIIKSAYDKSEK